ncbi:MAG TPA: hypothetical protein VEH82_00835 [Acidimicrobiales bacterium]|nr:hypothetical protein [Acidimicrobiales bacterium]
MVADTKVTDPGSNPLGTGPPAGSWGLGALVVVGAAGLEVLVLALVVVVVVLLAGALVAGDELHAVAPRASASRAATGTSRIAQRASVTRDIFARRWGCAHGFLRAVAQGEPDTRNRGLVEVIGSLGISWAIAHRPGHAG